MHIKFDVVIFKSKIKKKDEYDYYYTQINNISSNIRNFDNMTSKYYLIDDKKK